MNRLLRAVMERQPPPLRGKRRFKLLYATQLAPVSPTPFQVPEFLLFVNDPRLLPENYMNFLQARLREKWEYPGLPILLRQHGREKRESGV